MSAIDDEVLERLSRIFDSFTCGAFAAVERKIIFANQQLADMVGVPREALFGRSTSELVPAELRPLLEAESELVEQGDLRTRLTALLHRNGTARPVLVMPMRAFEAVAMDAEVAFDLVVDLGTVMTAKHALYDGEEQLRSALTRIALELQTASLLAGGSPAATPALDHPALAELSKREREVLAHLVEGDRVPAIASRLFISQHTVRNHLKSIFRKLDVGSQGELIEKVREIR